MRTSENSVKAKFSIAPSPHPDCASTAGEEEARTAGGPLTGKGERRRGPPKRCDTYKPTTAKRVPPLPGDHNQLYQVAIFQSHSAPVRRAYPRRAIIRPPAVDELRRIPLPRTRVNRGLEEKAEDRGLCYALLLRKQWSSQVLPLSLLAL